MPVTTNVTIAGSALLTRPVLDLGLLTDAWSLGPAVAVVLANLTLANLSPAYYSPGYVFSQFGILSERVWAFQRYGRIKWVVVWDDGFAPAYPCAHIQGMR